MGKVKNELLEYMENHGLGDMSEIPADLSLSDIVEDNRSFNG